MDRPTIRQGDVILVPIEKIPASKTIDRENGRIVLAHGEVTGHAHAIVDERAELLAPDGSTFVTVDEAAELYLLVHGTDPVELVHEEHSVIAVEPGAYRVQRMREYAPEAPRRLD